MAQLSLKPKSVTKGIVTFGSNQYETQPLATAIATSPVVVIDKETPRHTMRFEGVPEEWALNLKHSVFMKYEGKLVAIVLVGDKKLEDAQQAYLVSAFALKKCRYVSPEEIERIRRENEAAASTDRDYHNTWTPRESRPRTYDRNDRPNKFQSTRFSGGKPGNR